MAYKCLLYEVKDRIATLTLNRPERLNALGDTLRDDLHDAITALGRDDEVRVLVITGAGRGFCSGGDVKAMSERDQARRGGRSQEKIAPQPRPDHPRHARCPKPIIAAINGAAAGAGMNLALACDMRIASTAAKFSQAFVKRGLHPDWGGTYFLPRVVGIAKACELIFTGESSMPRKRCGSASSMRVAAPEELMPKTYELARKIAAGPAGRDPARQASDLPQPGCRLARGAGVRDVCAESVPRNRGLEGRREGVHGEAGAEL